MKIKRILTFIFFSLSFFSLSAENVKYSISVDAAYYPESEYKTSSAHMAKLTGIYYGLEARATLNGTYTLQTPLGEHWLLKDSNVKFNGGLEFTPISIRPKFNVAFTPVPFLEFSAGTSVGSGWSMFGWEGMCLLNKSPEKSDAKYEELSVFEHFYYDFWVQGTFQFDTGAIFPGDWTHVLLLANYQILYTGLFGIGNDEIWEWQATDSLANGLQFCTTFILAYQMPKLVNRVGIMTTIDGHFKSSDFVDLGGYYKGNFKRFSIAPLAQITFSEKNSLTILAEVSSRRAFEEEHDSTIVEPYLNYIGYEWFFRRIALSYTHKFN